MDPLAPLALTSVGIILFLISTHGVAAFKDIIEQVFHAVVYCWYSCMFTVYVSIIALFDLDFCNIIYFILESL